ncbi:hypothetical protein [Actinoplanes sp. NPDC026623]|uniref:hypothetical protein n=1 Tax=Actinoplanes sp. NPDC026623 TaxID=3155610 RepID=UPI0033C56E86
MAVMAASPVLAADALISLLTPLTQLLIGVLVLAAVLVSLQRLIMRGPTRMGGAMLIIGGALVCVAVLSYLAQSL